MSDIWKLPKSSNLKKYEKMYKSKHGMFAGVPIVCQGTECPYFDVCIVEVDEMEEGTRCPMEASAVIARFEMWCNHFNVDISGEYIKTEELVDASLIRDLVENEIQMLRAENRIAMNSDIVGETIVEIDKKCNVYKENTILPEAQYKLQLQEKRYKIMNLLDSTRKDKAARNKNQDPSAKVLGILKKVDELLPKTNLELEENNK